MRQPTRGVPLRQNCESGVGSGALSMDKIAKNMEKVAKQMEKMTKNVEKMVERR